MTHSPRRVAAFFAVAAGTWLATTAAAQAAGFVCASSSTSDSSFPGLTVGNDSAATVIRFARSVTLRATDLQGTLPDSLPAMRVTRYGSVRYVADVTGYFYGAGRGGGLAVVVSLPEAPNGTIAGIVTLVRGAGDGQGDAIITASALSCAVDQTVSF
jgi:hypothetical protein